MIALRLLAQWLLNGVNPLDHAGNWLLLGDADETLSARIARARAAGVVWARLACRVLTFGQVAVTGGRVRRDHCAYALDARVRPNSREILDLCRWPPRLRRRPKSEVEVSEQPDAMTGPSPDRGHSREGRRRNRP